MPNTYTEISCKNCQKVTKKHKASIWRAKKMNRNMFCGTKCSTEYRSKHHITKSKIKCSRCNSTELHNKTYCKPCYLSYQKNRYNINKTEILKTKKLEKLKRVTENQKYLFDLLNKSSCSICNTTNILTFEFHHLANKKANICHMVFNSNLKQIKVELEKCQILCSNCHSIITHKENNTNRYKYYLGLS